jgi:tetratricopeptide (TPR) repeat protein
MLRPILAASLVLVATAALADSKSDCSDSKDHDLRIKGCSALLQRNPKDVIAYNNRGDAYGLKGDLDRAISDYGKAIELNPNYAAAYNGRARAYTGKGDYVHAVADVTRASELTSKPRPWPAVVKAAPAKAPAKAKEIANSVPATPAKPAAEKSAAAPPKAPVAEKPADSAWPPWVQGTLAN